MSLKPLYSRVAWTCVAAGAVIFSLANLPARIVLAADKPDAPPSASWSPEAAARYMDSREVWWQSWDRTQKDHGTLCISCHTQATFGLARPALRNQLHERQPSAQEQIMLASIEKRVRGWRDMQPFYSDALYGTGKEIESRNAESVLNAIILASYDTPRQNMSERTRMAFDNAWALQSKTGPNAGAWVWQDFDYTPWESKESQYHWAALMAVTLGKECRNVRLSRDAVVNTPGEESKTYCADAKIAANLKLLLDYLRSHYSSQPIVNKVVALWANKYFPGIVASDQKPALIDAITRRQQDDGGWSLSNLGTWERRDKTPLETPSDGYATGLIVLVLEEVTSTSKTNSRVTRGRTWLEANQDKTTGAWPAWSLNKNRDPKSPIGQFMSDAATSYAVLALEDNQR